VHVLPDVLEGLEGLEGCDVMRLSVCECVCDCV